MKILVVEDYAESRDLLSLMFQTEGFETRCASDGKAGFDLAQKEHPDLIVTDIEMPNLDGIGMIKLIRQEAKDKSVPIIVLSACQGEAKTKALEAGANYALAKPLQFDLLYEMIAKLLKPS